MTPTQREAALRLASSALHELERYEYATATNELREAVALLRELLAEPVINHKMTTEPAEPCFNLPALDAARELTRKA